MSLGRVSPVSGLLGILLGMGCKCWAVSRYVDNKVLILWLGSTGWRRTGTTRTRRSSSTGWGTGSRRTCGKTGQYSQHSLSRFLELRSRWCRVAWCLCWGWVESAGSWISTGTCRAWGWATRCPYCYCRLAMIVFNFIIV